MNAKIMEVFRSIQGEGPYAGVPQVFVRFFECNMHCVWCDTPASIGDTTRRWAEVDGGSLLQQVRQLHRACHSVSITGGEPLVQKDFLKKFLPQLRAAGMQVYLETNGTLPQALEAVISDVDIVAMDLKLPSSTQQRGFWQEHEEFLRIALRKKAFIKVVLSRDTRDADVRAAVDLTHRLAPEIPFVLQPNYFDMREPGGSMAKCLAAQRYSARFLKDVRVIPQLHKFLKIR